MKYSIGPIISIIGELTFIARRNGVYIIGPGFARWIPNSWYDEVDTDQL